MVGRDETDPLLLQVKEAKRSVLEPYCGVSEFRQKGQRVVEGQRLMQAASDPLLGWYRLRALDNKMHDFYVRQMWDGKASIDLSYLAPTGLARYAEACGLTLARAHARTGFRVSIASYLGDTGPVRPSHSLTSPPATRSQTEVTMLNWLTPSIREAPAAHVE